jgi:hypothetical protein
MDIDLLRVRASRLVRMLELGVPDSVVKLEIRGIAALPQLQRKEAA